MAAAITLVFLISLILSAVAQAERAHCKGEAGGHKFYYVILFNCKQYTNAPSLVPGRGEWEKISTGIQDTNTEKSWRRFSPIMNENRIERYPPSWKVFENFPRIAFDLGREATKEGKEEASTYRVAGKLAICRVIVTWLGPFLAELQGQPCCTYCTRTVSKGKY